MKIWMIGASGTVASTAAVGTLAAQRGLLPLEGLLTATAPFRGLPLPPIEEISFGGCDLRGGNLLEAALTSAAAAGIFSPMLIEALAPELRRIPITPGISRGLGPAIEALVGDRADLTRESARDAIARIARDLAAFAEGDAAVVVNLASTEPLPDPDILEWGLERLERALDADDSRLPPSTLYAYAALRSAIPFINFTPSSGASVPALVQLAREAGLPLAGRDGKTGETLVKTALAPMFAIRALTVEGWYGTNILGNTDGQVLNDPTNRASKVASKEGVLEQCLGYPVVGDVRIDYFPPLQDHKVAWDFIQFRGWGGHRMRMQFTWEGTDSALAAPLIIDLARLMHLARARGEAGPVAAFAHFFKSPEGTEEMNLHRQYENLLRWIGTQSSQVEPRAEATIAPVPMFV